MPRLEVIDLSFRSAGNPRPSFSELRGRLYGARNVLVLVHGYNNSRETAWESYARFLTGLFERSASLLREPLVILRVYWKGDWPLPQWISAASYPWKIQTARETAERLHVFLKRLTDAESSARLTIVGHSLGNRLVAQLLHGSDQAMRARVERVCMMAAAVPRGEMETGGLLQHAPPAAQDLWVLYSSEDSVLRKHFPKGERAYRLAAFGPPIPPSAVEAVGFSGRPFVVRGQFTAPRRRTRPVRLALGHSDYWGSSVSIGVVAHAIDPRCRMPEAQARCPQSTVPTASVPRYGSIGRTR